MKKYKQLEKRRKERRVLKGSQEHKDPADPHPAAGSWGLREDGSAQGPTREAVTPDPSLRSARLNQNGCVNMAGAGGLLGKNLKLLGLRRGHSLINPSGWKS